MSCKPGGCQNLGCEGGRYCYRADDGRIEVSAATKAAVHEALNKIFNKDKSMTLNTHPYNQAELKAAQAAGFLEIPDWSESLTKLRLGQRGLDDALPGSDLEAASSAYKLVVEAVAGFDVFFKARGIDLAA